MHDRIPARALRAIALPPTSITGTIRRRSAAVAAALVVITATSACAAATAPADALDAPNHIHRLVVAPDGASLLVGSHDGLFSVDLSSGQTAGPIGEQSFDVMGLAVADGVLLASGHPGAEGPAPATGANLGLLRSDDLGETWQVQSLEGVADFHALAADAASGTVFGAAGGQVVRSDDFGATWSQAAAAEPYDLLVTGDELLMTGFDGVSSSIDRGASFEPLEGAPPVALLSSADGTVFGIEPGGALWRREADGSWSAAGAAPEPIHAFAALPGGDLAVATESGLLRSDGADGEWAPLVAR